MRKGAADWVPESKCHKMEQRRKSSDKFVRAAGEQAAWNENETGSEPYAGIQSDQSSTNAGASCKGLRNKDNLSLKSQKKNKQEWERLLVSVVRQQQQGSKVEK